MVAIQGREASDHRVVCPIWLALRVLFEEEEGQNSWTPHSLNVLESLYALVSSGILWCLFGVPDLLFNATRSGWIAGGRPGKLDRPSHVLFRYPLVSSGIL